MNPLLNRILFAHSAYFGFMDWSSSIIWLNLCYWNSLPNCNYLINVIITSFIYQNREWFNFISCKMNRVYVMRPWSFFRSQILLAHLKDRKKIYLFVFRCIIGLKNFYGFRELIFDHGYEFMINAEKFRPITRQVNPSKAWEIINKDNKISRPSYRCYWRWSPNIRMHKIKRGRRIRSTDINW